MVHLCYNDEPLVIQQQQTNNNLVKEQQQKQTVRSVNISNTIIQSILSLLKRDCNEQGKHLIQYFQFFNQYSSIGINECLHLIKLDIPLQLIQYSLDETTITTTTSNATTNSITPSRHQYVDFTKLYCVVSTLLRCFDVSSLCSSSTQVR